MTHRIDEDADITASTGATRDCPARSRVGRFGEQSRELKSRHLDSSKRLQQQGWATDEQSLRLSSSSMILDLKNGQVCFLN